MAAEQRSPEQIEADLAAARARMSANISQLINEIHPKIIKQRQMDEAKDALRREFAFYKSQIIDDNGPRYDRIVVFGGALAGITTFLLIIRGIISASKKKRMRKITAQVNA
ncbi:DUF3618 domain-containing protein [Enemella sp. A6]|uniref:DUF3618 domain-containing protein n=1 Tax=Enemella sp. A6 TaxID=3440152 RepID=UPI003EBC537A